ncbi:nicotinate-nucleotide--dimethylbenzimidazole phosphoribosyltransferase [Rhizobacter sp. SG703]|uniref:nicotinate-nucleotide--dimethylbenzimidazole phosphoribosyltransferase n=1 Tax=Rhizobacter sp. SG703 TaxID=2587140 RepID=UPI001445DC13|nr:nicotinate-nucleotide--dimethylbenzimidazole phosphoribosyltransferase [Rhizobacter sp. SG703]NKI92220.1 nicotinate-nucleotide--dimethylbenzimidazole phosphoribosyltransferase [Rhizobacter sp. SG703]
MSIADDIPRLYDAALAQRVRQGIGQVPGGGGVHGSVGLLAQRLAQVRGSARPRLERPQLVVFAADHGIAARTDSAPRVDAAALRVRNLLAGRTAASMFARRNGLSLTVIDCGLHADLEPHLQLVRIKMARGTLDSSQGPAMTIGQCRAAIERGTRLVTRLPGNVLLLGETGMGNEAAALLMSRLTGIRIADCAGFGSSGRARECAALQAALDLHVDLANPVALLAALGGLEIAALVGAVLQAARERRVIVVGGFVTTAAVAVAARLAPALLERCVFSHGSQANGHARWLQWLGAEPLLDAALCTSESCNAVLAWPLLKSAEQLLETVACAGQAQDSR